MKKFLIVLALLPLIIAGCSSDDDLKFDFDTNHIYGEWRVTHVKTSTDETYLDVTTPIAEKVFEPTYITFKTNGSYSATGFFGWGSGKFKTSGKTLITYIDGEEFLRYEILSLTEQNAEAIMREPDSSSNIRIKIRKEEASK